MTNDPNPSPMGTPEWTPEQIAAFNAAEDKRDMDRDEFGRFIVSKGWTVGGEFSGQAIQPKNQLGSLNEQLDSSEADDE